jgi:hypothetical protein
LAYPSEFLQRVDSDNLWTIDAAAGGAFFSLTIDNAKALTEDMVSNQGWSDDRLQPHQRGTHTVMEVDMLTAKMDLIMKRLDDITTEKAVMTTITHAMDSCMTCEVCGNTGHSGSHYLETREDVMYMNNNNNGYRPKRGQMWNQ